MSETKEYSKTLCDERHMAHEKYEEMRFAQIEEKQCGMVESIKEINGTLKERFDREATNTRTMLYAVVGTFATAIIGVVSNILFKLLKI